MDLKLKNKKVFITASTSGIGYAVSEAFLKEGATVAINGRDRDKLIRVVSKFKEKYDDDRIISIWGDATDTETMKSAFDTLENTWGSLDVLVPCVGTGKTITGENLLHDEWDYMMNKNLYGTIEIIRLFLPMFKQSISPAVVLISSIAALGRISAPPAYAAAKNALLTLNSYIAGCYDSMGIRINAVVPGNIYFQGGRWEELERLNRKEIHEYIERDVPMKRFGKPEEVADAIVFLASEKSSFTNGAVLTIDGGQNRSF